jgi:hypothetical protein
MLFADIFSIMVQFVNGNVIEIPIDITIAMTIAAIFTNIPIFMILLSWILPNKLNKRTNCIASVLTIIYVVGGGVNLPHYYIIAGIEIVLLITVFLIAIKMK